MATNFINRLSEVYDGKIGLVEFFDLDEYIGSWDHHHYTLIDPLISPPKCLTAHDGIVSFSAPVYKSDEWISELQPKRIKTIHSSAQ